MSITQVLLKDIPKEIYQKGWSISFPSGAKDIFFKFDKDLKDVEMWELTEKLTEYPKGIMDIHNCGRFNYFRVTYYPNEITEEDILKFINNNHILNSAK